MKKFKIGSVTFLVGWPAVAAVFYKDNLDKKPGVTRNGKTKGPFIWIRTDQKNNTGLHRHELFHAKLWYVMQPLPFLAGITAMAFSTGLLYNVGLGLVAVGVVSPLLKKIPRVRLWNEAQGNAAQLLDAPKEVTAFTKEANRELYSLVRIYNFKEHFEIDKIQKVFSKAMEQRGLDSSVLNLQKAGYKL